LLPTTVAIEKNDFFELLSVICIPTCVQSAIMDFVAWVSQILCGVKKCSWSKIQALDFLAVLVRQHKSENVRYFAARAGQVYLRVIFKST
jgi:hypothetical protein